MRVLAFRHFAGETLGTIRAALESRNIEVDCVDLFRGDAIPDCGKAGGLLFMGGDMCANDDLEFLQLEIRIIQEAAERGQPVFGVCLGAQLIARALGGRVYPGAAPESGWMDVRLDPVAARDPIFARLNQVETVFQLHQDAFDLPPGAEALAGSVACSRQAFRWGDRVYGVQFHPEVTPAIAEGWRSELRLPPWATPPGAYARLAATCDALFGGWRDLL